MTPGLSHCPTFHRSKHPLRCVDIIFVFNMGIRNNEINIAHLFFLTFSLIYFLVNKGHYEAYYYLHYINTAFYAYTEIDSDNAKASYRNKHFIKIKYYYKKRKID